MSSKVDREAYTGRNVPAELLLWLIGRTNPYDPFTRVEAQKALNCNHQTLYRTLKYYVDMGVLNREFEGSRGKYNEDKTLYYVIDGFFDNAKRSGAIRPSSDSPLFEQELMETAKKLSEGEWIPGYRQYESYLPMYVANILAGEHNSTNKEQLKTFSASLKAITKSVDRVINTEPGTAYDKELANRIVKENLP